MIGSIPEKISHSRPMRGNATTLLPVVVGNFGRAAARPADFSYPFNRAVR